jgi:hypothetical protein
MMRSEQMNAARKILRLAVVAVALLVGRSASASDAGQTPAPPTLPPTVDLSQLPGPLADQVRSVLHKATTLTHARGFHLMGLSVGQTTNDLRVPILTASPRSQVAPSNQIGLPWVGGSATYHARLLAGATQQVAAIQAASARAVFSGTAVLPGTYTVQITDSGGKTAIGSFDVVQNGPALNPDPIEQYRGRVPPPVFAIAKASLFAKQGREFYLQAYQLLAPYANYPQVEDLNEVLTQGALVK